VRYRDSPFPHLSSRAKQADAFSSALAAAQRVGLPSLGISLFLFRSRILITNAAGSWSWFCTSRLQTDPSTRTSPLNPIFMLGGAPKAHDVLSENCPLVFATRLSVQMKSDYLS
jgi:hypothetical protein